MIHIKNGASLSMMETVDMLKQKALWMQVSQIKTMIGFKRKHCFILFVY